MLLNSNFDLISNNTGSYTFKLLEAARDSEDLPVNHTIAFNLSSYVALQLTPTMMKGSRGQELLQFALGLRPGFPVMPVPDLVDIVLRAGADPNDPQPIWWEYLDILTPFEDLSSTTHVETLEIMIFYGASSTWPRYELPEGCRLRSAAPFGATVVQLMDVLNILRMSDHDRERLKDRLRARDLKSAEPRAVVRTGEQSRTSEPAASGNPTQVHTPRATDSPKRKQSTPASSTRRKKRRT
jgi:hypothetical protein